MRNHLRDYREGLGLTMPEMAQKLSITYSYYTKIEYEERQPSYSFMKKFKKIFPKYDMNLFFPGG